MQHLMNFDTIWITIGRRLIENTGPIFCEFRKDAHNNVKSASGRGRVVRGKPNHCNKRSNKKQNTYYFVNTSGPNEQHNKKLAH